MEQNLKESQSEVSQLKDKLSGATVELEATKTRLSRAQTDIKSLQSSQEEEEEANKRLKEKLSRLEVGPIVLNATTRCPHRGRKRIGNLTGHTSPHFPQAQLQSQATESSEAELALHAEVRGLRGELDEAKRKASRLNQEQRELSHLLEDMEKEKDSLKLTINQLEGTKGQQERALEKLSKEVRTCSAHFESSPPPSTLLIPFLIPLLLSGQHESLTASSREEAQALRAQLEEQREKARREMQEAQRHGSSAQSELDRSHMNLRRLEEEVRVCRTAHVVAHSACLLPE